MRWTGWVVASGFVVAGVLVRAQVGKPWLWLPYNLALAWVPVVLGLLAARSRVHLAAVGPLWLAFLPNAPYLLTDLIHLPTHGAVPRWFDAALLGGAGALGVALGAASLHHVAAGVERHVGAAAATALRLGAPPLCGLGIWLGRDLRLDSWDLVLRPLHVLGRAAETFGGGIEPWAYAATFGGVLLAATLATWPTVSLDASTR